MRLLVHDDQSVCLALVGGVGFLAAGVTLLPSPPARISATIEGIDGKVDVGGGTDDVHRRSASIGHQDRLHVEVCLEQVGKRGTLYRKGAEAVARAITNPIPQSYVSILEDSPNPAATPRKPTAGVATYLPR